MNPNKCDPIKCNDYDELSAAIIPKKSGLTLFTKSLCPYSIKARIALAELNIPYLCYDIDLQSCNKFEVGLKTGGHYDKGRFTVPQIFWGTMRLPGGYSNLANNLIKHKKELEQTFKNLSLTKNKLNEILKISIQ